MFGSGRRAAVLPGRWIRAWIVAASVSLALILTGCAEPRSEPAPLGTVSLGVDGAFTIAVGAADHIIRDDNGSYFCVLRRPDDLADLRAQFNPPSTDR